MKQPTETEITVEPLGRDDGRATEKVLVDGCKG